MRPHGPGPNGSVSRVVDRVLPIALFRNTITPHEEAMTVRQHADILEEGCFWIGWQKQEELLRVRFVKLAWHEWQRMQTHRHRGEGECIWRRMIKERSLAHGRADDQQRLGTSIPEREDKITHEITWAFHAPGFICTQDERRIRKQRRFGWHQFKIFCKFGAIIEPSVADKQRSEGYRYGKAGARIDLPA